MTNRQNPKDKYFLLELKDIIRILHTDTLVKPKGVRFILTMKIEFISADDVYFKNGLFNYCNLPNN